MSEFSGKCDLYDHMMMEKTYPRGNSRVSDELECFELFKTRTNGVLYQHHHIVVSERNQEYVKDHCSEFNFIPQETQVADRRMKAGVKTVTSYTYEYFGKQYTLKELNRYGVYITLEIHFSTLLDLIPYYPYIITAMCSDATGERVIISNHSFVEEERQSAMKHGWTPHSISFYQDRLQEHYLDVCRDYFLKDIDIRTKQVSLLPYKPLHNGYYELLLPTPADYMHPLEFIWADGKFHSHWCSPELKSPGVVWISEQDVEYYLADDIKKNAVQLQYVEKCEFINLAKEGCKDENY